MEERGWTGFHKDEQGSFIYNYTLKGFLCEAARTLKEWGVVKQLQDKFKRHCFVSSGASTSARAKKSTSVR